MKTTSLTQDGKRVFLPSGVVGEILTLYRALCWKSYAKHGLVSTLMGTEANLNLKALLALGVRSELLRSVDNTRSYEQELADSKKDHGGC